MSSAERGTRDYPASNEFKAVWKHYKATLSEAQQGKCAYCESRFGGGYPGDVEHYRPKTEIRDIRMTPRGHPPNFTFKPGYWWLAYRFENYLYSCGSCNTSKGNYFPLRGRRRKLKPGSEGGETPQLLNPFLDDPAGHLEFDEVGGVRGRTSRGKWTVKLCGLQERRTLVTERKRTALTVFRDIEDYELALSGANETFQDSCLRRLFDACAPSAPYAAMARTMVEARGLTYDLLQTVVDAGIV